MKKQAVIEGILLLAFSFLFTAEGLRLTFAPTPSYVMVDMVGPGKYILFLGIAMMSVGIVHLITYQYQSLILKKIIMNQEMIPRMVGMVAVLVMYAFLMNILGYILSSVIFFFLEFRIAGVKHFLQAAILAVCLTAAYYVVFVYFCAMVFPRGVLANFF